MPCQQTVCGGSGCTQRPTPPARSPDGRPDAEGNNIARLAHTHSASSSFPSSFDCPNSDPRAGGPINLPLYKAVSLTDQNNKQAVGTDENKG